MNNISILEVFKIEFQFELKNHAIKYELVKTSIGPLGVNTLIYSILKNSDIDMCKQIKTDMYEDQLIRTIQRLKL